jgi:hypothetical protein
MLRKESYALLLPKGNDQRGKFLMAIKEAIQTNEQQENSLFHSGTGTGAPERNHKADT